MALVGSILTLLALIAVPVGLLIGVFWRGRRKKGWLLFAASLFVTLPLGIYITTTFQDKVSLEAAKEVPLGVHVSNTSFAEKQSQEQEARSAALLERPDALMAYCAGIKQFDAMSAEAKAKFGDSEEAKEQAWREKRRDEIQGAVTDSIGVPWPTWAIYADENGWDHRCEALDLGWKQVELGDIKAAGKSDRSRVKDAVELNYIRRLNVNEGGFFFDKENFRAVVCRTKVFSGFHLIGCQMRGGGFSVGRIERSNTDLFLAARIDENAVIVPVNGDAKEHMKQPYLPDMDNKPIPLGKFVGPNLLANFDWAEVKHYFDD